MLLTSCIQKQLVHTNLDRALPPRGVVRTRYQLGEPGGVGLALELWAFRMR